MSYSVFHKLTVRKEDRRPLHRQRELVPLAVAEDIALVKQHTGIVAVVAFEVEPVVGSSVVVVALPLAGNGQYAMRAHQCTTCR